MRCAASERYIFVAGGESGYHRDRSVIYSKSCNIFDIKEKKWIELPDAQMLFGFAVFVDGDYAYYTIGQHKKLFRIFISKPEEGWVPMADMLCFNTEYCVSNNCGESQRFVIAGGYHGEELRSMQAYNPSKDQWEILPDLPEGLHGHAGAVLDNKLYLVGGSGSDFLDLPKSSCSMYDMASKAWAQIPDIPKAMQDHSAVAIGKWIVISGGKARTRDYNIEHTSQSIYILNTASLVWRKAATQLPFPLCEHGSCRLPNGMLGPRVAVIGGQSIQEGSDKILAIDFVRLSLTSNQEGHFSLIEACKLGLSWTEGVREIVLNQPDSVAEREEATGLLPFMLASDLDTCYELLHCTLGKDALWCVGIIEGEEEPAKKKARIV